LGAVSDEGPWAPAITGLAPSLFLILYRISEISVNKRKTGSLFMENSNWLTRDGKSINKRYIIYLTKLVAPSLIELWVIVYGY